LTCHNLAFDGQRHEGWLASTSRRRRGAIPLTVSCEPIRSHSADEWVSWSRPERDGTAGRWIYARIDEIAMDTL
jgi:hypothetical protein